HRSPPAAARREAAPAAAAPRPATAPPARRARAQGRTSSARRRARGPSAHAAVTTGAAEARRGWRPPRTRRRAPLASNPSGREPAAVLYGGRQPWQVRTRDATLASPRRCRLVGGLFR